MNMQQWGEKNDHENCNNHWKGNQEIVSREYYYCGVENGQYYEEHQQSASGNGCVMKERVAYSEISFNVHDDKGD